VSRRWLLDAHLYGSSRLPGSDYYSYLRTDLRLGWRVVELGEVTLGIQNLFNRRNLEYRSQLGTPAFFLKRTAYVGLSWRF